jgi:hypothetical protein
MKVARRTAHMPWAPLGWDSTPHTRRQFIFASALMMLYTRMKRARVSAIVIPPLQPDTHYPPRPASGVRFGFNGNIERLDVLASIHALGSGVPMLVRGGGSWDQVETYDTGALGLPPKLLAALRECRKLGIEPVLVAAYGPPVKRIGTVKTTAAVAVDSYVLPVANTVVALAGDYVLGPSSFAVAGIPGTLNGKASYQGSYVRFTTPTSLTLAAKLKVPVPAGTELHINRQRYSAINGTNPAQVGAVAYMRYVRFLAAELHRMEFPSATICLWNEFSWPHEKWANLVEYFDHPPSRITNNDDMQALLLAALKEAAPPGVHFCNGASDKSGNNSILRQLSPLPTPAQANGWFEGMHPFGNPEVEAFDPSKSYEENPVNPVADKGHNLWEMAWHLEHWGREHGYNVKPLMSECGIGTNDDVKQARALLRRVLSCVGMNITCLIDIFGPNPPAAPGMAITVDGPNGEIKPRAAYVALRRLCKLIAGLGAGGSPSSCPTISGVKGNAWPIMSVPVYGANGAALIVWQRTWGAGTEKTETQWESVPSPSPCAVSLKLGSAQVLDAVNLRTGQTVETGPLQVADDPIAVVTR